MILKSNLGDEWRAEGGRSDGVADGDVAISTHDCQQQRARKLIH